jgi:agmatine deiminase
MPAEWAPREGTLMAWPIRAEAWLDGLEEAREGYAEVANAIVGFERLIMIARPDCAADARRRLSSAVEIWELPHDDSWMRDNGPTFLLDSSGDRAAVNWRFNAWGGKYQPFGADDALAPLVLERLGVRRFDAPLVMEGGSIHSDGEGTILTTAECLLNPNRNPRLSKAEIEGHLRDYTGARAFLWLEKGIPGDETDGHVDNVACFAAPGRVVVQVPAEGPDANADFLSRSRDAAGRLLEVLRIPEPPEQRCRGERLTLSYVNYYPVEGGLILPVFGKNGDGAAKKADDRALAILREAYPGRKIVAADGIKIIKGGGNVHCITQQIPRAGGKRP